MTKSAELVRIITFSNRLSDAIRAEREVMSVEAEPGVVAQPLSDWSINHPGGSGSAWAKGEWREIESAPRDGRWVYGRRPGSPGRIQTVKWHSGAGQWLSRGSRYIYDLTQWMPLEEEK